MNLSKKIQTLRKENGLSQEQLAEKLLVSRQAVSKWESGQSIPDVDNIIAISDLFGVTTDYLLKDIEVKENLQNNENNLVSSSWHWFDCSYNPKRIKIAWILGDIVFAVLMSMRIYNDIKNPRIDFGFNVIYDVLYFRLFIVIILTNIFCFIFYKYGKFIYTDKLRVYAITGGFILFILFFLGIGTSF